MQGTGGLVSEAFGHPSGASRAHLGRLGLNWGTGGLQTASGALGLEGWRPDPGPRPVRGQEGAHQPPSPKGTSSTSLAHHRAGTRHTPSFPALYRGAAVSYWGELGLPLNIAVPEPMSAGTSTGSE